MALVARRSSTALALSVCLTAGMLATPPDAGEGVTPSASEYQIKAAYIYYFATFIEWPSEVVARRDKTFVIGVLGEDPFGTILEETLRGKTIKDCRLVVRRFVSPNDALHSDILFISSSEQGHLPQILGILDGAPVLTVGESDQFVERGGQIGLRLDGRKVRFDINTVAATHAGLKISSQLLKLGKVVQGQSPPRG